MFVKKKWDVYQILDTNSIRKYLILPNENMIFARRGARTVIFPNKNISDIYAFFF